MKHPVPLELRLRRRIDQLLAMREADRRRIRELEAELRARS